MITTLARADSAAGEVALRRRDAHTELIVGGVFAMDTVDVSTEVELATVALRRHRQPRRVLVGGLGLGFTAETVLADPRVESVEVVEIVEPLIDWARSGLLPTDLADPRLHLRPGDVATVLEQTPGEWDLILLDVDNGPDFLVRPENADLYAGAGLVAAAAARAPGGLLAIWSSHRAPELRDGLGRLGSATPDDTVEELVRVIDRDGRRLEYAIYLLSGAGADLVPPHPGE